MIDSLGIGAMVNAALIMVMPEQIPWDIMMSVRKFRIPNMAKLD